MKRLVLAAATLLTSAVQLHAATGFETGLCTTIAPAQISVTFDTEPAPVGSPIAVDWALTDQSGPNSPTYLVISTSAVVRFEGGGNYALAPGARGPYGLEFGQNQTRVIVPLHSSFNLREGTIGVIPYEAGPVSLEWGVFDAQGCNLADRSKQSFVVVEALPGQPMLLPSDEFSAEAPETVWKARNAPFEARVFGGYIEVLNTETGETVLRTAGSAPHFSPTGRFLETLADENGYIEVFDLLAERKLGRFDGYQTYWSHADSFLYLDRDYDGRMEIVRTLHGRRLGFYQTAGADVLGFFENPDGEVPAAPDGLDINPGAGWGSFVSGAEAWALQLSLESGTVAFAKVAWKNIDGASVVEDNDDDGLVFDLGARASHLIARDEADLLSILASKFGLAQTSVVGWNAGERLLSPVDEDESYDLIDMDAEPQMGEFYISQESVQVERAFADVTALPSARLRGAFSLSPIMDTRTVDTVVGAQFDHLSQISPPMLRSARDDEHLKRIEAELGAIIAPSVATFGREYNFPYETFAFPDPNISPPAGEAPLVDMIRPGRDTWTFDVGKDRLWLTQTVASTRLAHQFSITMIRRRPDGSLDHADLLSAAEAFSVGHLSNSPGAFKLVNFGDARTDLGATFGTPSGVSVAGGQYLLLATRPLPRLIVFDLVDWKVRCAIGRVGGGTIASLWLHSDLRHLTQIGTNGVAEVYDCDEGDRVLAGLYVDGEFVVVDESGQFDGSVDATAYIELKIPGIKGRHFLSQFASVLRVEGLAERVLAGERLERRTPLAAPPALKVRLSDTFLNVSATSATGLSALEVYSDGRLVHRASLSGRNAEIRLPFHEFAGGIVTLVAADEKGLHSAPSEILLPETAQTTQRKLYGLAVGIDRYPRIARGGLDFAAADARRMARLLQESTYYDNPDFVVLSDEVATGHRILSELNRIVAEAAATDTILISFAGHGLSEKGRLRLALSETSLGELETTSLDFQEVIDAIRPAHARVLVLLDVCHAGLAAQADVASNNDAANALMTENGAGLVILSASKGRQFSEESTAAGGGRFSVALEEALGARRASTDLDGNGNISVSELYRAIKARVVAATEGRQTPWLARNRLVGDFDLF